MKTKRIHFAFLLGAAAWLVNSQPTAAQVFATEVAHVQTTTHPYVESDKGYWQVHTDPNSRSTVVQFFDSVHHLLYQESMPRKYIKLTRRNVKQFDALLAKLMARELLSDKVKTYDLIADSRTEYRTWDVETTMPASEVNITTAMTNVYVVQGGKMKVILKNPALEYYDIRMIDSDLRTVYFERTNGSEYGRWFDVSKLAEGSYSIHITSPRKKLNYKLLIDGFLGYRLENLK